MNLFYMNLKSIYETEDSLKSFMPLEPLHFYLREFFLDNLKNQEIIVDPLDFSFKYKLNPFKTLNLFLTLANNGMLKKFYRLECDDCGEPSIEDSLDKFYECIICKELLINLTEPKLEDLFNNISYLFEIIDEIKEDLNDDLKVPPSLLYEQDNDKGGTMTTNQKPISVTDVLNHSNDDLSSLASEQDILRDQINTLLGEGIKSIS
ncbi:hypothetical protein [Lysinibacillus sp. LZ02]|uniref:hypothetical protein n=1 Tax=Lysinibacillus sp. LZ02 TaxID=3420668 RepID=UPI003D36E29F